MKHFGVLRQIHRENKQQKITRIASDTTEISPVGDLVAQWYNARLRTVHRQPVVGHKSELVWDLYIVQPPS